MDITVDWEAWTPFDWAGTKGDPAVMPRKTAKKLYDRVMEVRFERISALRHLLERNRVQLTDDDRSVSVLSEWMLDEVTPSLHLDGEPEGRWFGVAFDAGLYLGELLIARAPGLRWEFNNFEKAGRSYQRHVVHGFHAPYKKFHLAPEVEVVDILRDAVSGRPGRTRLQRWYDTNLRYEFAFRAGEDPSPVR